MGNKFCPRCGKELDANAKFCIACGTDTSQPGPPPVTPGPYVPVAKPPRKLWPIFVILGAAVVVITVAALLLFGVIKLGGGAAFAPGDISGYWTGQMTLDSVNGTGSEADTLRAQIGQTQTADVQITLGQDGKGTASMYYSSLTAELTGSTLVLKGQIESSSVATTFNYTGNITKTDSGYSMTGNYSATQSGISIQGKLTLQHSATTEPARTLTPFATVTTYAATPTPTQHAEPVETYKPVAEETPQITMLEGTWQYMYDVENSYAECIEFHADGTCIDFTTQSYDQISGTYTISGNTVSILYYLDGEPTYYNYTLSNRQLIYTDPSTGEIQTFVQVE